MSAAVAFAAIGVGLQLFGQIKAASGQSRALKSEAAAADRNARAARLKAQADAEMQMIQARSIIASQKAGFAAAGVEGGSVDASLADSAINAEMDRLSILYGGNLRSNEFSAEAASKRRAASDVKKASLFNMLGTGFQAAGQFSKG